MNIVHAISSAGAGGAEVYVRDLAMAQLRQGHRPAIAFISHAVDVGRSAEFEREFLASLDAAGIPYAFVGHECRRNPLLGAARMRRFCREQGAEIYHSHLKYSLLFGARMRIPHVHTHHNELPHAPRWMWPLFNRLVDAYVGISELCADRLRQFTGRPVTTIRNAIDSGRIRAGAARNGELPLRAVAIGSATKQKNYELLVEALSLLPPDNRRQVTVEIIGDGAPDGDAALRELIASKGLGETIRLAGGRTSVSDTLADAQLFVMSSAWEGLPIALLEATTSGLGFIATDAGGCAEVAELCGNGIIVPRGDAAAFAAAIESLIDDPRRVTALSANAIANARLLGIAESAARHMELYETLVRRPAASARRAEARNRA